MDDALRSLQRAVDADPSDRAAVQRLEQALRRAEEGEALRARYRMKFLCPLRFEELRETDAAQVRSCDRCQREVHLAPDLPALARAVGEGQCVAFPRELLDAAVVRLAGEPELDSTQDVGSPCLVSSELGWVDLGPGARARALEPGLAGLFDPEDLHAWPALPLRVEGGVLHLAVARTEPPAGLLDRLRLASGIRELRLWLAEPFRIYELLELHAPRPTLLLGMLLPEDPGPPRAGGLEGFEGPRLA